MKIAIVFTTLLLSQICGSCAETFAYSTSRLPMSRLNEWLIDKHRVEGSYCFEYGDGGGEIILKAFLSDEKSEKIKYYGVIFEPSGMLEKQQIKILPEFSLKGSRIEGAEGFPNLVFRKFKIDGKEIRGILYKGNFYEADDSKVK